MDKRFFFFLFVHKIAKCFHRIRRNSTLNHHKHHENTHRHTDIQHTCPLSHFSSLFVCYLIGFSCWKGEGLWDGSNVMRILFHHFINFFFHRFSTSSVVQSSVCPMPHHMIKLKKSFFPSILFFFLIWFQSELKRKQRNYVLNENEHTHTERE